MSISRLLDTSPLKPIMTQEEVKAAILEGISYKCRSICVQPCDIPMAAELCKGTETQVCCVLDFPHGKSPKAVKAFMAKTYCEMGTNEIDMVMNYGYAISGKWDIVQEEIAAVTEIAHSYGVIVKVIFEASQLTAEQITKATEVSIAANADFVKTATGFFGDGAAEAEVENMLKTAAGRCQVKPSGGIRDYARAKMFADMGVGRIGIGNSSLKKIMDGEKEAGQGEE